MSVPEVAGGHHTRRGSNLSNVSIGSDHQAGAADADLDFKTNGVFRDVRTQVRASVSEAHRNHKQVVVRPIMASTRPDITAQLNTKGWSQACEDYFSGQGIEVDQPVKDDAQEDRVADPKVTERCRVELCCKLLEAAIAQRNLLAFMVIPIPKSKLGDLVAFLEAFVGVEDEPDSTHRSMMTVLTAAKGAKSKAASVLGMDE